MEKLFVLLQKELIESWKTYKIAIVFLLCIVTALAVPFFTDSSYSDNPLVSPLQSSYIVFNFVIYLSVGLTLLIPFTLMNTVAKEVKDGLTAAILTKPAGRGAYILSKFLVSFAIFAVAIVVGFIICYVYAINTTKPFDPDPVSLEHLFITLGFLLLYVAFAISLTIFISSIFKNNIVAGGIALALLVASIGLFMYDPVVREFVPFEIVRWGLEYIYPAAFRVGLEFHGTVVIVTNPYWYALGINIIGVPLFLLCSIGLMKYKAI